MNKCQFCNEDVLSILVEYHTCPNLRLSTENSSAAVIVRQISYDVFRCPGLDLDECQTCLRRLSPGKEYQTISLGTIEEGVCLDVIAE